MSQFLGNIKPLSVTSSGNVQGQNVTSVGALYVGSGVAGTISSVGGTGTLAITTAGATTVSNQLIAGSFQTPTISSVAGLSITGGTTTTINSTGANNLSLNTATITSAGAMSIPSTLNVTGSTTLGILAASATTIQGVLNLQQNLVSAVSNPISTTPYTILGTQSVVEYKATAASIINLPSCASTKGQEIFIELTSDSTANNVVITPNASEKIETLSTITMSSPGDTICLFSNGINWKIR